MTVKNRIAIGLRAVFQIFLLPEQGKNHFTAEIVLHKLLFRYPFSQQHVDSGRARFAQYAVNPFDAGIFLSVYHVPAVADQPDFLSEAAENNC